MIAICVLNTKEKNGLDIMSLAPDASETNKYPVFTLDCIYSTNAVGAKQITETCT